MSSSFSSRGFVVISDDFQTAIEFFRKAYGKPMERVLTAYLQKSTQMLEAQIQEIYQDGLLAIAAGIWRPPSSNTTRSCGFPRAIPTPSQRLAELKVSIQEETERIYNEGNDQFDKNQMDAAILNLGPDPRARSATRGRGNASRKPSQEEHLERHLLEDRVSGGGFLWEAHHGDHHFRGHLFRGHQTPR
jgi:hypothetical protein